MEKSKACRAVLSQPTYSYLKETSKMNISLPHTSDGKLLAYPEKKIDTGYIIK